MGYYINNAPDAQIKSVEFEAVAQRQYAFVHVSEGANLSDVKAMLQAPPASQTVASVTRDEHGNDLLICYGTTAPELLLDALRARGEMLQLPPEEKKAFNPWLWRGLTSIVGQSLQIASGFSGRGTVADKYSLIGFGTLNMAANISNILFGKQEKFDPHHLRQLKEEVNQQMQLYVGADAPLPDIDSDALQGRALPERTLGQKTYDLMQQYSVSVGEVGLRTLGATQLAFPFTNYTKAAKTLGATGSLAETIKVAKNTNPVTFAAGLMTLAGKFTSMAAKEPDPYNPEPKTMVDTFRQNIAFPLSSVIEGVGAAYMTHDRFKNQKIMLGGKEMPDYLGGTGNAVFVGGYAIRFTAPYGTREVDMKQIYAHISEVVSTVPDEKRARALADAAVQLKRHFHDKPFSVSEIYAAIAEDLRTYHNIEIQGAAPSELPHDGPKQEGAVLAADAGGAPDTHLAQKPVYDRTIGHAHTPAAIVGQA